ncbi:hypothetical protein ASC92_13135 [Variovorax sp. Root411]|nr:hypothetical protein ASC92_13135 [Variovorax sp. Root411]
MPNQFFPPSEVPRDQRSNRRTRYSCLAQLAQGGVCALLAGAAMAASANNVGENSAWQFQISTDKANQAAVQDMIQRKKAGSYGAANYTTNNYVGRQYNCDVGATAQGNQGSNSTVANSPSTTGAAADSTGNANTGYGGTGTVSTGQANSGTVGSAVIGSTSSSVQGWSSQALNSNQTNTGSQSASVSGSTACAFGALN